MQALNKCMALIVPSVPHVYVKSLKEHATFVSLCDKGHELR